MTLKVTTADPTFPGTNEKISIVTIPMLSHREILGNDLILLDQMMTEPEVNCLQCFSDDISDPEDIDI